MCRRVDWDLTSIPSSSLPEKLAPSLRAPYKAILFSGTFKERSSRLAYTFFLLINSNCNIAT